MTEGSDGIPMFAEHDARKDILRPKRVAVVREWWGPLLQTLEDQGIADLIRKETNAPFPQLVIINRIYTGPDLAVDIDGPLFPKNAEVYPREEDVDLFKAVPVNISGDPLRDSRWTVAIEYTPESGFEFDSTLRIRATRSEYQEEEPHVYGGNEHKVLFEINPLKNLRVVGREETFNGGPVDQLDKRGRNRMRSAINRAFKMPEITRASHRWATLSAV